MPTGKDIPNQFFIQNQQFDCIIEICMLSADKELMQHLMDTIEFHIPPSECKYEFLAFAPLPNTMTLERKIFVKKNDYLNKSFLSYKRNVGRKELH